MCVRAVRDAFLSSVIREQLRVGARRARREKKKMERGRKERKVIIEK